ncbi:MAG TPA: hypothetical protein VHS97_01285 [Isosphaeraceae bacterium]|nr:hypothetical protein [Isosphaeraceae bacterium]
MSSPRLFAGDSNRNRRDLGSSLPYLTLSLPAPRPTIGDGAGNQAGLFGQGRGLRVGLFFRLAVDMRLLRRGVFARWNVGQHSQQADEFHGLGEVAVER